MRAAPLLFALLLLAPTATALPSPGVFCDVALATTGRVFPEAEQSADFVSFDEALCGLKLLETMKPDLVQVKEIGRSVGWSDLLSRQLVTFPVIAVEITNEKSAIPRDAKIQLLFQLSIHGNEKDGREGGLRAIEDLARGISMGRDVASMLDYELLVFTFPNPDGWKHEEVQYRLSDPANPFNFVRENGHGKDLNRQWPTVGWMRESYTAFSEPEIVATYNYLEGNFSNLKYATDIHGMLNPADGRFGNDELDAAIGGGPNSDTPRGHFLLTMLAAGRLDPLETRRITALSELIKERVNKNPELAAWTALPATGAWGGEANDWGMAVDAIGYEDAGFTGDFFQQDGGLNVPDLDFEMSYNHILFDNYYPGAGALVNKMAIASVRDIVESMMVMGATDVQASIETHGRRTLVIENPVVVTNKANTVVGGWAEKNALDDAFDIAHRVFEAAPVDYFKDLAPYLGDSAGKPGILDLAQARDVTADRLANYDNVVVPGSAARDLSPASVAALKAWTEKGGRLVLTDSALQLVDGLGLGKASMDLLYTGAIDITDRSSGLVKDVRGLARQTYVAVPLGYSVETFASPVWYVSPETAKGGQVAAVSDNKADKPTLGELALGQGSVVYFGAFLPDPTDEAYHPYGLDSYSATYTANQILRNALGWEEVYKTAPLAPEKLGAAKAGEKSGATLEPAKGVPGLEVSLVLGALVLLAAMRRRK